MKRTLTLLVVGPDDEGAIGAVRAAIEAQGLATDEIEICPWPHDAPAPEVRGDVIAYLDAQMIPAPGFADAMIECVGALAAAAPTVVVGRVAPDATGPSDAVTLRLPVGRWQGFEPIDEQEEIPLARFHARVLGMSRSVYESLRDDLREFHSKRSAPDFLLGIRLRRERSVRLRYRPRVVVMPRRPMTFDDAVDGVRGDWTVAARMADRTPGVRDELAVPRDAAEVVRRDLLDARLAQIRLIVEELGKVDLRRLRANEPAELSIADVLREQTDAALRLAFDTARDLGLMDGRADAVADESTIDVHAIETAAPVASIIIVERAGDVADACLTSIREHTPEAHETIVIQRGVPAHANATFDADAIIPLPDRVGYAEAANRGIEIARGTYIVLMEPEALVAPGWLSALVAKFEPGVAAVGPVSNGLLGPQHVLRWIENPRAMRNVHSLITALGALDGDRREDVGMLQPLVVAMTRDALGDPPSLDERFRSAYGVLLHLARRIRRSGARLVVAADAFVARRGGLVSPVAEATGDGDDVGADLARLHAELGPGDGHSDTAGPWDAAWTCLMGIGELERPSLSVIIPVCNQLAYTVQCLESLRAGSVREFEVVIFDNGSTDGTAEYLHSRGDIRVIRSDQNLGFAPAVNAGLAAASGRLLLVLNNDVVAPKRMIERLLAVATKRPEYGMLGAVSSWSAPSQLVPAGYRDLRDLDRFADARWERYGPEVRPEAILLGFCLLIRREVLDTIGVFDEGFEIGNFEDGDLSMRATLAGFRLGVADGVYLHHYGSMTFRGENLDYQGLTTRNHARFLAKWGGDNRGGEDRARAIEAADGEARESGPAPARRPVDGLRDGRPEPEGREPETPGVAADAPPAARVRAAAEPRPATDWIPLDAGLGNGDPSVRVPDGAAERGSSQNAFDVASVPAGDLYLLADHELGKANYKNAAELFRWAIERMPDMVLAHMGLGIALARAGNVKEAIDALERCVELQPDLSEAHNNLGIAYHLAGRDDDARAALRRAVELDPENADARANLDEVETRAGRPNPLGAFTRGA